MTPNDMSFVLQGKLDDVIKYCTIIGREVDDFQRVKTMVSQEQNTLRIAREKLNTEITEFRETQHSVEEDKNAVKRATLEVEKKLSECLKQQGILTDKTKQFEQLKSETAAQVAELDFLKAKEETLEKREKSLIQRENMISKSQALQHEQAESLERKNKQLEEKTQRVEKAMADLQ